ncbi:MAG: hypothetical protein WCP34_16970, partial [Pseudomonadota bacterium]
MNPKQLAVTLMLLLGTATQYTANATPVTSHPRLWITQTDLPRLTTWAASNNPMYTQGLLPAVQAAIQVYNNQFFPGGQANPNWPDSGVITWPQYVTESYAELFAFMSRIDPDSNTRIQHAQRARNLLMHAINEAAKGHLSGASFRDPQFATSDRSRIYGEGFPLTVDWIYDAVDGVGNPILTAQDKATIRQVFLMWADDNTFAFPNYVSWQPGKPVPVNTSSLLTTMRYSMNNYSAGHMRQLIMMSLSMDDTDDPPVNPALPAMQQGNSLHSYFAQATGSALYQEYAMFEDAAVVASQYGVPTTTKDLGLASGGLPAEGIFYGECLSFVHGALLAMHTAGVDDPTVWGPQVSLIGSPYWDKFANGLLSSITPNPQTLVNW